VAFRLPSANTTLSLYNGYIPGIFLDVHVISLLQSRVDYSSDGPRCLRQPSLRQSPSSHSPKTFRPSLVSTGASPVHLHDIFGQTTEDHHVLRSSFASTHAPLGLRVPSAPRPKVVSPTYSSTISLCILLIHNNRIFGKKVALVSLLLSLYIIYA